jgi:hypothetical protein
MHRLEIRAAVTAKKVLLPRVYIKSVDRIIMSKITLEKHLYKLLSWPITSLTAKPSISF